MLPFVPFPLSSFLFFPSALDTKTQDNKAEEEKIKLLLLGPGESGKSTIFRQMKLIYGVISEDDRISLVSSRTYVVRLRQPATAYMAATSYLLFVATRGRTCAGQESQG